MSQANATPRPRPTPMVVVRDQSFGAVDWLRLLPSALMSAVVHVLLIGLLFLFSSPSQADDAKEKIEAPIQAEAPEEPGKNDPFLTTDVDPAALDFDQDINYNIDRLAEVSVPGKVIPDAPVGIENGDK